MALDIPESADHNINYAQLALRTANCDWLPIKWFPISPLSKRRIGWACAYLLVGLFSTHVRAEVSSAHWAYAPIVKMGTPAAVRPTIQGHGVNY